MGVITKPSSVQRSVIVRLLVSCGKAAGCGRDPPPSGRLAGQYTADTASCPGRCTRCCCPSQCTKNGRLCTARGVATRTRLSRSRCAADHAIRPSVVMAKWLDRPPATLGHRDTRQCEGGCARSRPFRGPPSDRLAVPVSPGSILLNLLNFHTFYAKIS